MGMDLDAAVAKIELDNLRAIVFSQPHGERKDICNDIIEFVKLMKEKYGRTED